VPRVTNSDNAYHVCYPTSATLGALDKSIADQETTSSPHVADLSKAYATPRIAIILVGAVANNVATTSNMVAYPLVIRFF